VVAHRELPRVCSVFNRRPTGPLAKRGNSVEEAVRTLRSDFNDAHRANHKEARRLALKSWHIPFVTIFVGCWIGAAVLSAVLTIFALGPVNPIT
jgi:hypothetical protein